MIQFILFLLYTIFLFFISDYRILAICVGLQILLMLFKKINLKQALYNLKAIAIFILFTMLINLFAMGVQDAILIGIRLVIICNMTYIFSKQMTTLQIANVIQTLLMPLRLIGMNTQSIALVISIAMAFVPIIRQEIHTIQYALKAKGFKMGFWNSITHLNLIFIPLLVSLLRKINEVEYALKAKAYVE